MALCVEVSTHSRPKAAGQNSNRVCLKHEEVSTHSRPKAAGKALMFLRALDARFNSQPPEGGWFTKLVEFIPQRAFQLTAARRRLAMGKAKLLGLVVVSTHSRPKAAGASAFEIIRHGFCFNSQPPEGGWINTMRRM